MFARFDENPAMNLQDIKERKRYRRTDARMDGQRENSIPPTNKVCGGYKYPFFQNQNLRGCFNQAPEQQHFCTVNSLSMLQKSLGYAINKFKRFYSVPEKIVIFKKINNDKFEP